MSSTDDLPSSLNLSEHLSAYKYFMVCSLTVAAWDSLVLSPRTWRLLKSEGWPVLKILFHFMRLLMPIEFTIVGVAFFDTSFSQSQCRRFYLFEPICTAVLLAAASITHAIRVHGVYDKNRTVLFGVGALVAVQIVVTGICCAFYQSVPLEDGQGCIAGPKHNWVGVYWLSATLVYTCSFALALSRSFASLKVKKITLWKLMLRDGLSLYGTIWGVNMVNMLFWFIVKPTDDADPIKTIVTSMAAIVTTSMTMRIILSVRGPLTQGGSFALSGTTTSVTSRTTHVISTRSGVPANISAAPAPQHMYTLDDMRSKPEGEWRDVDSKPIDPDVEAEMYAPHDVPTMGVRVTIDRDTRYDTNWK
ncbi:hypothetical protein FISHEDRAFT_47191 [Fistulina hepatica ATCC 64428]|uniref:DUF6533 domain-containing protein n=1 Tax=Fistulina hepatica ATCC 64428 TaxID=1128425 RepID=A0A0D7A713_9AGAR|nr:hypothetical protein FISHEDRAFT_47191 [Fistulina hepatica ATCC 64428]